MFPILAPKQLKTFKAVVKLLLRPVDSETEWQEMAAWPIQLEFRTVERRSETA